MGNHHIILSGPEDMSAHVALERPWDELAPETQDAIKAVLEAAVRKLKQLSTNGPDLCGAYDGPESDPYGVCDLPAGHPDPWHRELRDGRLWASWRGEYNGPGRPPEEFFNPRA